MNARESLRLDSGFKKETSMPKPKSHSPTRKRAVALSSTRNIILLLLLLGACRKEDRSIAHDQGWRSAPDFATKSIAPKTPPPLSEDQALELAWTLPESAVRQEVDNLALATQQAVGRCAAAMGAASSKGKLGQPYSDPEKTGGITDPLSNVGGRYGYGALPSREDRERVYHFAYELAKRGIVENESKTAVLLFAARLFGRGTQPLPPLSATWDADTRPAKGAAGVIANSSGDPFPPGYPRVQPWRSDDDGCVAAFPSEPQRVEADMLGGKAHAYQSYFKFENERVALAQVTVTPRTERLTGSVAESMLAMSHNGYARMMGAAAADSKTSKAQFGHDKPALEFEVRYSIDGVPVVSTGYWVLDSDRILRVNVVYPTMLSSQDAAVARHFPKTFGLVGHARGGSNAAEAEEVTGKPSSNFVRLPLPKGVTVELPKNWVALSDNQLVTLDTVSEAKQDLAGITRPESSLPFAANYYDDARNVAAMFNVRFYPEMEWTQDFVRGISTDEVAELDAESRKQTEAQQHTNNMRLLEWKGTKRRSINGITAFAVEYRRAGTRAGTSFCVRLVRVFNAGKSFTVTVSYREDAELLLRPICDRIIESIRQ